MQSRQKLATCYRPVDGGILVCGHRRTYRIDRGIYDAERGGGSDYNRYIEARARHPEQGEQ